MLRISCFALALTLTACASPFVWVKAGASEADFDRDMARCKYEAASATANYSTGRTAGTMSGAIAQGLGEGMAIGSRRAELIQLCLQAQGYTKRPISNGSPPTYQQQSTAVAVVQPVQPVSTETGAPVVIKDSEAAKVVQVLSDNGFPLVGDPVRFKQKGNLTFYEARGSGNRLTQVVCEAGVCRLRSIYD